MKQDLSDRHWDIQQAEFPQNRREAPGKLLAVFNVLNCYLATCGAKPGYREQGETQDN